MSSNVLEAALRNFTGSARAKEYLQSLQERTYAQLGVLPPQPLQRFDSELLDKALEKWGTDVPATELAEMKAGFLAWDAERRRAGTPTKFEEVEPYTLMTMVANEIHDAADAMHMTVPVTPMIGTLPSGRVNAAAMLLPPQDYIVLFEIGMFGFVHLLSKVVALTFSSSRESAGVTAAVAYESVPRAAGDRFVELIGAYLTLGSPYAAPPFLADGDVQVLANNFRIPMQHFVLGHEYGHIISGHFGSSLPTRPIIDGLEDSEIARNWQQEFEADAVGIVLAIAAGRHRGLDVALSYGGAALFFSSIESVERAVSIVRTGRDELLQSDTHPPPNMRRAALRSLLPKLFDESVAVDGALQLGDRMAQVSQALWQYALPFIEEMRRHNVPLAATWN